MIDPTHFMHDPLIMIDTFDIRKCLGCTLKHSEYKTREKLRENIRRATQEHLQDESITSCETFMTENNNRRKRYVLNVRFKHIDNHLSCNQSYNEPVYKIYDLIEEHSYFLEELNQLRKT